MSEDGFLPLLKLPGPTSHTAVQGVRRRLGRKAGHLGTLDPAAAGVLVVAVGRATRLAAYLGQLEKSYRALVVFGLETDTGDAEGRVVRRADASGLREEAVERALAAMVGEREHRPPLASAVKQGGEPLYRAFRRGERRAAPIRRITVYAASATDFAPGRRAEALVDFRVSKGTYIRVLAEELGAAVGFPAVLGALVRTAVGPFSLAESLLLEEIKGAEDLRPPLFPFGGWPRWTPTEAAIRAVLQGRPVRAEGGIGEGLSLALQAGELLAVGRREGDLWRPLTVLRTPPDGGM